MPGRYKIYCSIGSFLFLGTLGKRSGRSLSLFGSAFKQQKNLAPQQKRDKSVTEFDLTLSMTKKLKEELESFLKECEAHSEL